MHVCQGTICHPLPFGWRGCYSQHMFDRQFDQRFVHLCERYRTIVTRSLAAKRTHLRSIYSRMRRSLIAAGQPPVNLFPPAEYVASCSLCAKQHTHTDAYMLFRLHGRVHGSSRFCLPATVCGMACNGRQPFCHAQTQQGRQGCVHAAASATATQQPMCGCYSALPVTNMPRGMPSQASILLVSRSCSTPLTTL